MARSMAGMFNQMNQAIQNMPTGRGMLDIASRGLGGAVGAASGMDPYSFMSPGAKVLQGQADMADLDMSTAEGLSAAAQIYGKMGHTEGQTAMAQAALQQRMAEQQLVREQHLRETLVRKYSDRGYTDQAEAIASGAVDLEEAARDLREIEKNALLIKRGTAGRKIVAKAYGINEEDFDRLGLADVTDDQFDSITKGLDAETKAFQRADGTIFMGRERHGKVFDKDTQTWRNPSEMGLKPAPQMQKVFNVSNKMVEALALKGVDNFVELHNAANDAQKTIDIIDLNMPLIDDMSTGLTAPITQWMKRLGSDLGMTTEAPNAEVFLSNAGKIVAQEIKAFGAGTGLSDADRQFAERIAAGDITMTPDALKRLLNIRRQAATKTIEHFEDTKKKTKSQLGTDAYVMDSFQVRPPQQRTGMSESTRKYYNE